MSAELSTSSFIVYEMEGLLDLSEAITLPVLAVVLHRLERRFDGRPTYLIVDEAKASLAHPYMARKGKEYAVTVRKKNVVLVLAFQDTAQLCLIAAVILDRRFRKLHHPLPSPAAISSFGAQKRQFTALVPLMVISTCPPLKRKSVFWNRE